MSTLFLLIGMTGVALAFIARRFDYAERQAYVARAVLTGVNRPGTSDNELSYSYEFDANGEWVKNAKPRWPNFLLDLVGKDFFYSIESLELIGSDFDEEVLQQMGSLTELKTVCLAACTITSDELKCLQDLRSLEYLDLTMHKIEPGGLKHIAKMTGLEHLNLGYPETGGGVTDADLHALSELQQLEYLNLMFNSVTDAGIEPIARLKNLKTVVLHKTQVTQEGAAELRRLLPNCTVHYKE